MANVDLTKVELGTVDKFFGKNLETDRYEKKSGYGFIGNIFFHISKRIGFQTYEGSEYAEPRLETVERYRLSNETREPKAGDKVVFESIRESKGLAAIWWAFKEDYDKALTSLELARIALQNRKDQKYNLQAIITEHGWPKPALTSQSFGWHGASFTSKLVEGREYGDAVKCVEQRLSLGDRNSELVNRIDLPKNVNLSGLPNEPKISIYALADLQAIEALIGSVAGWGIQFKISADLLIELGGEISEPKLEEKTAGFPQVTFTVVHPVYGSDNVWAEVHKEERDSKSPEKVTYASLRGYPKAALEPVRAKIEEILKPIAMATRKSLAFYELGRDLAMYRRVYSLVTEGKYGDRGNDFNTMRLVECLKAGHEPRADSQGGISFGLGEHDELCARDFRVAFGDELEIKDDAEALREILMSYLKKEFATHQQTLDNPMTLEFKPYYDGYVPAGWYAEEVPANDLPEADVAELVRLKGWWTKLSAFWETEIRGAWAQYQSGEAVPQELFAPPSSQAIEDRKLRIDEDEEKKRHEAQDRFTRYCEQVRSAAAQWKLALLILDGIPVPEVEDGFLIHGIPQKIAQETSYIFGTHTYWKIECRDEAKRYERGDKASFVTEGIQWDMIGGQVLADGSVEFYQFKIDQDGQRVPSRWSDHPGISRENLTKFVRDNGVNHQLVSYMFYFLPPEQAEKLFQELTQIAAEELVKSHQSVNSHSELRAFVEKWGTQLFDELWNAPTFPETEQGKRYVEMNGQTWVEATVVYESKNRIVSLYPPEGTRVCVFTKGDDFRPFSYRATVTDKVGHVKVCLPGTLKKFNPIFVVGNELVQGKVKGEPIEVETSVEVAMNEEGNHGAETADTKYSSYNYRHFRTSHKPGWEIHVVLADGTDLPPDSEEFPSRRQQYGKGLSPGLRLKFKQIWQAVPDTAVIIHESRGEGKYQGRDELRFVQVPDQIPAVQRAKLEEMFGQPRVSYWLNHQNQTPERFDSDDEDRPAEEVEPSSTSITMGDLFSKLLKNKK